MSKCKYCCDFFDAKYILRKSIPLCLGTKLNVSVDINCDELNVYMHNSFEGTDASEGKSFGTKINYCPMCGRKLESEE